jgi:hypothetical protein
VSAQHLSSSSTWRNGSGVRVTTRGELSNAYQSIAGTGDPSDLQGRVLSSQRRGIAICEMDELPENLSALSDERLREERNARDERLRPLFCRWPSLSKFEMRELRRVYNERVRLARRIGRTRRRT